MLFDPSRHEILQIQSWNPQQAQACIRQIAHEAEENFHPETFFPVHKMDDEDAQVDGFRSLYMGAAGVLASLSLLQREGFASIQINVTESLRSIYAAWQNKQVDSEKPHHGYFIAESGILLPLCLHDSNKMYRERMLQCVKENVTDPANELFWAAPGTALAARLMYAHTHEPLWQRLWLESARHVLTQWQPHAELACDLWHQDLYGRHRHYIGAAHGFAGNVLSLLLGKEWLSQDERDDLYARAIRTTCVLATRENGLANWRANAVITSELPAKYMVQWCHGAPGIVTSLAGIPVGLDADFDQLLLEAGELIWHAGPLRKGSNLCHGTGGNGYAFLALFQRTGDERWLVRSRAFAMHAITQYQEALQQYGRGRFSLWTGDIGLAFYLRDCLQPMRGIPSLDLL